MVKKLFQPKGFALLASLLLCSLCTAQADEVKLTSVKRLNYLNSQPTISIIIDDMGYRLKTGKRAIDLPGELTYSFLPHAPHVNSLSMRAYDKNKEIMLHLPMQTEDGRKLGPGGLTENLSEEKFQRILSSSINAIPFARGFNNHMGSELTKNQLLMKRLMQQVASNNNLFFVDSKTTSRSVAFQVARQEGLRSIQRDIFIDHELSATFIEKQLKKLIRMAQVTGSALAIGHPKTLTIAILEKWLPTLEEKGIRLVSVSKLIELRQERTFALLK